MNTYYTAVMVLVWTSLGTLCTLVMENNRIPKKEKWRYYATYGVIALAALAEWIGIWLDTRAGVSLQLLRLVKCCDYILTPLAGGMLARQIGTRNRWNKGIALALLINVLFQLISCFTGWMVQVEPSLGYRHGPLYGIYIFIYLFVIAMIIGTFVSYGKNFPRRNRISLYAIMALIILGVVMQELGGKSVRTAYIALSLGATFFYIHYQEFSHLRMDLQMSEQKIQIERDSMTGVFSRYSYMKRLEELAEAEALPAGFGVFVVDINDLKAVNDSFGHDAGDELICGAALCISEAFGEGVTYRTGGDEFVVFTEMTREQAEERCKALEIFTRRWRGEVVKNLALAVGYARAEDNPSLSCEELIKKADQAMYEVKEAYYRENGKEGRMSRSSAYVRK